MNNTKYYSSALAYDFEMFMPRQNTARQPEERIIVMPGTASRRAAKAKSASASRVWAIAAVAALLLMICAQIYLRAEITSVKSQINEVKESIAELESEETRLEIEIERKVSYANLEQTAKELGMQKTERNQIVYIRTDESAE